MEINKKGLSDIFEVMDNYPYIKSEEEEDEEIETFKIQKNDFEILNDKKMYVKSNEYKVPKEFKVECIDTGMKNDKGQVIWHVIFDPRENQILGFDEKMSVDDFKKIPHEFFIYGITGQNYFSSDVSLKERYSISLTPDMWINDKKDLLEFKTTKSPNLNNVRNRAETAYESIKNMGFDGKVLFCVGSTEAILSDVKLDQEEVDYACYCLSLGHLLWYTLSSKMDTDKIDVGLRGTAMEVLRRCSEMFDNKFDDCEDELIITNKTFDEWDKMEMNDYEMEMRKLLKESMKEVIEKTQNVKSRKDITKIFSDYRKKRENVKWTENVEGESLIRKTKFTQGLKVVPAILNKGLYVEPKIKLNKREKTKENTMQKIYRQALTKYKQELFSLIKEDSSLEEAKKLVDKGYLFKSLYYEDETRLEPEEILEIPDGLQTDELLHKKQISSLREIQKETRRSKGVKINFLNENDRIILAKRGVQSKEYKDHPDIKTHKIQSKNLYSEYLDTTCFDMLVKNVDWFCIASEDAFIEGEKEVLLEHYPEMEKAGIEGFSKELEMILKTRLVQMLKFQDLINNEIAISLSDFTRKDEFIFKKIKGYNLYLLIKPTSIEKHISYSIMVPKISVFEVPENSMMKMHDYDENWYYTDFCTTERHRLSHMICQVPLFIGMYKYFQNVFMNDDFEEHVVVNMLISLQSKPDTVVMGLLTRYSFMEAMKTGLEQNEPWKILSKFDQLIRDPFSMWIKQKIISSIEKMSINPPRILMKETQEGELKAIVNVYEGVVSWMTGKELKDMESVLAESYSCVVHNSNEGNTNQNSFKIYAKILSQEVKLYDKDGNKTDWSFMRSKTIPSDLPHSFRADLTYQMGENTMEFLKKTKDPNYEDSLRIRIELLFKEGWDPLGTLKASSKRQENFDFDDENVRKNMGKRRRCLENVLRMMMSMDGENLNCRFDDLLSMCKYMDGKLDVEDEKVRAELRKSGIHESEMADVEKVFFEEEVNKMIGRKQPFEILPEILAVLQENGVFSNLFRKQQLTGLREIFVLDMYSRIAIHFVERIARLICEDLPCEMLTKGGIKVNRIRSFLSSMSKTKEKESFDFLLFCNDSNDKSTWCQQFVMNLFGSLFKGLFKNKLANDTFFQNLMKTMCFVLNMVTMKKLELPKNVLEDFTYYQDETGKFDSFDPNMNELKKQFNGSDKDFLIKKRQTVMNNESNMGQGMLHYTSSLFHACFAIFFSMMSDKVLNAILRNIEGNEKNVLVRNFKEQWSVSSDDSLVMRAIMYSLKTVKIFGKEIDTEFFIKLLLTAMSKVESKMGQWACMTTSKEKSTSANFSSVAEFNSFWMVMYSLLVPGIKYVYAALRPKVSMVMRDRVRSWNELQKQCLENCVKIENVFWISIGQCLIHYATLGLYNNPWWRWYWNLNKLTRCPAMGYFLAPTRLSAGLKTDEHLERDNLLKYPETRRSYAWMYQTEGNLDVDEDGKTGVRINLYIGNNKKWRESLKYYGPPDNIDLAYTYDRSLLIREPENSFESLIVMYEKLVDPSSALAYSFQSAHKLIASSVYVLQGACITFKQKIMGEWMRSWRSLMGIMAQCISEMEKIKKFEVFEKTKVTEFPLSQELMSLNFKKSFVYDQVNKIEKECLSLNRKRILNKLKLRKVEVLIKEPDVYRVLNLRDYLASKWYPERAQYRFSRTSVSDSETYYKSRFPWMFKEERLLNPLELFNNKHHPFSNWSSMRKYIKSFSISDSKIFPTTPAKSSDDFYTKINNIIRLTQSNYYVLEATKRTRKNYFDDNITSKVEKSMALVMRLASSKFSFDDNFSEIVRNSLEVNNCLITKDDLNWCLLCDKTTFNRATGIFCLINSEKGIVSNECMHILNNLASEGLEGFVTYEVEQNKNERTYEWEGYGLVNFYIGKSKFKIAMMDNIVTRIETKSKSELEYFCVGIRNQIRKLGLKGTFCVGESFCLNRGSRPFEIFSNNNCSIKVEPDLDFDFLKNDKNKIYYEINPGFGIEISTIIRDKRCRIVRSKFLERDDTDLSFPFDKNLDPLNKAILRNNTMGRQDFVELLDKVIELGKYPLEKMMKCYKPLREEFLQKKENFRSEKNNKVEIRTSLFNEIEFLKNSRSSLETIGVKRVNLIKNGVKVRDNRGSYVMIELPVFKRREDYLSYKKLTSDIKRRYGRINKLNEEIDDLRRHLKEKWSDSIERQKFILNEDVIKIPLKLILNTHFMACSRTAVTVPEEVEYGIKSLQKAYKLCLLGFDRQLGNVLLKEDDEEYEISENEEIVIEESDLSQISFESVKAAKMVEYLRSEEKEMEMLDLEELEEESTDLDWNEDNVFSFKPALEKVESWEHLEELILGGEPIWLEIQKDLLVKKDELETELAGGNDFEQILFNQKEIDEMKEKEEKSWIDELTTEVLNSIDDQMMYTENFRGSELKEIRFHKEVLSRTFVQGGSNIIPSEYKSVLFECLADYNNKMKTEEEFLSLAETRILLCLSFKVKDSSILELRS